MIRWYDYVAAVFVADMMITLFLIGATSEGAWWAPFVFGGLAGLMYRVWEDFYCSFRLIQEQKND